ncbi:hypothetical protein SDC9_55438 [bioreactor metagenome]|uniref:Uncharacterized protein n=1 Tax=bioreactor metagenome TaxID=1076179 RepID=A0A644WZ60_9ZZZZ|nr:hypothetical protein [Sphaerochaeta sp.]
MRRVRLFGLCVLMCALSVLPFVGCSMESSDPNPIDTSPLTPYEASGFEDLFGIEDLTLVTDYALENTGIGTYPISADVQYALRNAMEIGLLNQLRHLIPSKKSMSAQVSVQLRDEVIAWEDDPYVYTTTVDHLDLELEGAISSVTTILDLIPEALVPDIITGDVSVQLSSKMHTVNSASLTLAHEFCESIYVSLDIEHTEPIDSRTDEIEIPISGPISFAFNYSLASLFSHTSEDPASFGVIPSVLEISLKPISNLTLEPLVEALITAEFQGPSVPDPDDPNYEEDMETYVASIEEMFTIIKPIIWGNSTEPALHITRKVMKNNGDVVVLKEATDADALLVLTMIMSGRR